MSMLPALRAALDLAAIAGPADVPRVRTKAAALCAPMPRRTNPSDIEVEELLAER